MAVEIDVVYTGRKKCHLTHPEGVTINTDARRTLVAMRPLSLQRISSRPGSPPAY